MLIERHTTNHPLLLRLSNTAPTKQSLVVVCGDGDCKGNSLKTNQVFSYKNVKIFYEIHIFLAESFLGSGSNVINLFPVYGEDLKAKSWLNRHLHVFKGKGLYYNIKWRSKMAPLPLEWGWLKQARMEFQMRSFLRRNMYGKMNGGVSQDGVVSFYFFGIVHGRS